MRPSSWFQLKTCLQQTPAYSSWSVQFFSHIRFTLDYLLDPPFQCNNQKNLPTAPQAQEGHPPEDRAPGHLAHEETVAQKHPRETSVASRYLEVVVVLVLLICIEPLVLAQNHAGMEKIIEIHERNAMTDCQMWLYRMHGDNNFS